MQYLQQTVLVVCDGRSLYSLYPEGKEKCLVLSIHLFLFLMNKISFYFCDLFIVMMLSTSLSPAETNPLADVPPNGQLVPSAVKGNNVNKHKKKTSKNTYKKSIYVWCWFVMFASGSSHASSYYKNSWICVSQEKKKKTATNKECTTRWHALGSDDASSSKKKYKLCTANKWNTHWSAGGCFLCAVASDYLKTIEVLCLLAFFYPSSLTSSYRVHHLQYWTAVELHHANLVYWVILV